MVWIRVPTVSASASTTIYFYYDELQDGSEYNSPSDVWADYAGVWHMNDATTSTILDSTSNDNDGTKLAADNPLEADGDIGKKQVFTGDDYISGSFSAITNYPLTFSVWFKLSATAEQSIFDLIDISESSTYIALRTVGNKMGVQVRNSNGWSQFVGAIPLSEDTLYNVVLTIDASNNMKSYINNVVDLQNVVVDYENVLDSWLAGILRVVSPANWLTGDIEDIQVLNTVVSSAWVGASYETQRDHFIYATSPVRCTVTDTDTLSGNGIAFLAFCAAIATLGVVLLMNKKMKRR